MPDARYYNGAPDDRDDALEMDRFWDAEPSRPAGCCPHDPAACPCALCARWRLALKIGQAVMADVRRKVS